MSRAMADDTAPGADASERAAGILALGREIATLLPEPWRSKAHGDLLYDDQGLPG